MVITIKSHFPLKLRHFPIAERWMPFLRSQLEALQRAAQPPRHGGCGAWCGFLELWTGIYWIYPVNSQLDPAKSMKITVEWKLINEKKAV